jgi:hypothetical protein
MRSLRKRKENSGTKTKVSDANVKARLRSSDLRTNSHNAVTTPYVRTIPPEIKSILKNSFRKFSEKSELMSFDASIFNNTCPIESDIIVNIAAIYVIALISIVLP